MQLEWRASHREWLYNMHIVISKRNERIFHILNWILSLLNLSRCLHGNSCARAIFEGFLCLQWLRFREARSHHYSTSGFLLQISLLCLPSSVTSPFNLSPLLLLLLLLRLMGSLIYVLSALIPKNELWKYLETSGKQYPVFPHMHGYIYAM